MEALKALTRHYQLWGTDTSVINIHGEYRIFPFYRRPRINPAPVLKPPQFEWINASPVLTPRSVNWNRYVANVGQFLVLLILCVIYKPWIFLLLVQYIVVSTTKSNWSWNKTWTYIYSVFYSQILSIFREKHDIILEGSCRCKYNHNRSSEKIRDVLGCLGKNISKSDLKILLLYNHWKNNNNIIFHIIIHEFNEFIIYFEPFDIYILISWGMGLIIRNLVVRHLAIEICKWGRSRPYLAYLTTRK